ncbi:SDR family NAD(P)-dependent oxidoreductase [Gordonia neofelifaecis]|uniref:3-oxoacyl-[acyl-carrier-protein] reductase MabA n=1 Tax=Gordonia neofelifaecis NRRL B-59395 TaxID=644548 RepID=F1YNV1_9ACTN|nr:SDR family oxidoreductase [Gordonia neofelifaecis]EGD53570.1 oxidoreductase [Gordonia neofelifaecis NRRL B-59395]
MTGRFSGRRALVTGASRGIGAAVARRLAAEGADVAIVARTVDDHAHLDGSLTRTLQQISVHGGRSAVIAADLGDPEQRTTIVERAVDALGGPVDILVNNAAAAIYQPMLGYPARRRRITFEVNLFAPLDLAAAVVDGMREAGSGWIVNITSATARPAAGPPFRLIPPGTAMGVYGSSKAALDRATNALAAEVYGTGIRVNAVAPKHAVLTEGARALVGDTVTDDMLEPVEAMVEAVVALCDCPAETTGGVHASLDLIDELGVTVRDLDGRLPDEAAL